MYEIQCVYSDRITVKNDIGEQVTYPYGKLFYRQSTKSRWVPLIRQDKIPVGIEVPAQTAEGGKSLYIVSDKISLCNISMRDRLFMFMQEAEIKVQGTYYVRKTSIGPQLVNDDGLGNTVPLGTLALRINGLDVPIPDSYMTIGKGLHRVLEINACKCRGPVVVVEPVVKDATDEEISKEQMDNVALLSRILGYDKGVGSLIVSVILSGNFINAEISRTDIKSTETFCRWLTNAIKNAFANAVNQSSMCIGYPTYMQSFAVVTSALFGDTVSRYLTKCLESRIPFTFKSIEHGGTIFTVVLEKDGKCHNLVDILAELNKYQAISIE